MKRNSMTADWTKRPYMRFSAGSNRIINEVKGVNRVGYDITPSLPALLSGSSADILAALRTMGRGWQTRINSALREYVKAHR